MFQLYIFLGKYIVLKLIVLVFTPMDMSIINTLMNTSYYHPTIQPTPSKNSPTLMTFFNTTAQGTLPLIRCLSFGICLGSFNSRPCFPRMLGPLSLRSRSHHAPASQSPIMWLHLFLLGIMMPFKERTQMGTTSAFPGNTQV